MDLWTGDGRYLGAFTAEHHPCMALAERRRVLGELAPGKAEFRATAAHAADGLVRATRLPVCFSAGFEASKPASKDTKCSILAPSAPPLEISGLSNSSLCAPLLSLSMMDAYADLWSHWSGRTPSAASTDPRKRLHALRGKA